MKYALLKFINHSALTLNLTFVAIIFAASIIVPIILRLMHKGAGELREGCVIFGTIISGFLYLAVTSSPNITILGDLEILGFLLLCVMALAVILLIIFGAVKFLDWLEDL